MELPKTSVHVIYQNKIRKYNTGIIMHIVCYLVFSILYYN